LVHEVLATPEVDLYNAIEAGVPTYMVDVIAAATGEQLIRFDMEAWLSQWMRQALPEFGGKSPAEMLRNPEGQRAVEQVLERMRGGLPA